MTDGLVISYHGNPCFHSDLEFHLHAQLFARVVEAPLNGLDRYAYIMTVGASTLI